MAKAQGLSLNTIVIAAVVLIVLIVLVMLFTGYFGNFVPNLQAAGERTCNVDGGFRQSPEVEECNDNEQRVYGNFGDNLRPGHICCKLTDCTSLGGICLPDDNDCPVREINAGTDSCGSGRQCCDRGNS